MNQHKTQVWLYVILAAIITSCSPVSRREKDNLQKIDEAWDMSDHNLDSSIILFQNIQNSVYRSTEYVRMKYDLLGIRLRDKSYMMPTSADSIKRITEFMEKHGSKKDCMRAYYYMGATYADLNDSPRAVESTLKALSYREGEQSCDTAIDTYQTSTEGCTTHRNPYTWQWQVWNLPKKQEWQQAGTLWMLPHHTTWQETENKEWNTVERLMKGS